MPDPTVNDKKGKYDTIMTALKARFDSLGVPYFGEDHYTDKTFYTANTTPVRDSLQYFYHPDHLGSSSIITNLAGAIEQHLEYIPYGEVFIDQRLGTWNTPYKFNAKELDEETGLYYYGARYLDPRSSLWISVDPLAEGKLWVSPYAYCLNNPVRYTDPDGRWEWDNVINFGKDVLSSFTVNTSVGFQVGVKANVAGKGVEVKANVASVNLGGVANGKSTLNLANPSFTKEATVKVASVGVSAKTEVKKTGNGTAQQTKTLSASALVFTAENTKTTNYVENNNGNYTELSNPNEKNTFKVTDSNFVRVEVAAVVGVEVSFDWNKAAQAVKTFIDSEQ